MIFRFRSLLPGAGLEATFGIVMPLVTEEGAVWQIDEVKVVQSGGATIVASIGGEFMVPGIAVDGLDSDVAVSIYCTGRDSFQFTDGYLRSRKVLMKGSAYFSVYCIVAGIAGEFADFEAKLTQVMPSDSEVSTLNTRGIYIAPM